MCFYNLFHLFDPAISLSNLFFSLTLYLFFLTLHPSIRLTHPHEYGTDFPLVMQHFFGSEGDLFQRFSFKAKIALIPTSRLRQEVCETCFVKTSHMKLDAGYFLSKGE